VLKYRSWAFWSEKWRLETTTLLQKPYPFKPIFGEGIVKRNKIPPMPTNEESKILIFRNLFLAKKDAEIASTIWNYFGAVKERWPEAWNNLGRQGNILPRTNGFKAFMRFLPNVYNLISDSQKVPSQSDFLRLLENISLQDEDFTSEIYKPGSSGEKLLLDHLLSLLVTYQR
jgi:hypothetical protein